MHHPDYSKPLQIMWLCWKCHVDLHAGRIVTPEMKALMQKWLKRLG